MKTINYTNYLKFLSLFVFALISTLVSAQDDADESDTKPISFSGSLDTYYRTNITGPNGEDAIPPNTAFANLDGFALGFANIVASYEGDNVGAVADLVFGPRGTEATFNSPQVSNTADIINQLYVYWNVSDKVTLTLGNFNTFLGYEVIAPAANFNYSTSYLFSFGPFSHTGIKADFDLGSDWSAMVGVFNPTDFTEANFDGDYAVGGQLGYSGQYLNALYSEGSFEIDYTGGFDLTDDFYLGLNAAYFTQEDDGGSFAGVALYPQYATSENFSLGLRAEYFAETDSFGAIGAIGANGDTNIFTVTLTGSATISKNLIIKPELRLDAASEDTFLNNDRDPNSSLASFVLAGIFKFD